MACCGDKCTLAIAGSTTVFEGHKYVIDVKSTSFDVRKFGDGRFGSWLSCAAEGTVTISHYGKIPNLVTGSTVNITCDICGVPFAATNTMVESMSCDVDAKNVVDYTTVVKLTGAVAGW